VLSLAQCRSVPGTGWVRRRPLRCAARALRRPGWDRPEAGAAVGPRLLRAGTQGAGWLASSCWSACVSYSGPRTSALPEDGIILLLS